jgi:hypothetical protein
LSPIHLQPNDWFRSYYFSPAKAEHEPAIYDLVLKSTFPPNLTDPNTTENHDHPKPKEYLTQQQAQAVIQEGIANMTKVLDANDGSSIFTRCRNDLAAAQPAVKLAPSLVPEAMVTLWLLIRLAKMVWGHWTAARETQMHRACPFSLA